MTQAPISKLSLVLDADHNRFSALFSEAQRRFPKLDPARFADHLHLAVEPVVAAVDKANPLATRSVVEALYDLSLDLFGMELVGANARSTLINTVWSQLLPALAQHIAAEPRRVVGALTNAAYNLSSESSARPLEWIELMQKAGTLCKDVSSLLQAGQVAAWRSGMAHYRQAALSICRSLDPSVVGAVLGLPAATAVSAVVDKMAASPWLDPAVAGKGAPKLRLQIVKCVGAFRGFGGLFISPPTVAASGDSFFVSDGAGAWLLSADVFGATFHRVDSLPSAHQALALSGFKIVRGSVTKDGYSCVFAELESVTSLAANRTTLAVTTPLSHTVYLVAVA